MKNRVVTKNMIYDQHLRQINIKFSF